MSTSRFVIVAGKGGHYVQAERLKLLLVNSNRECIIVWPDSDLKLVEYSSKQKYSLMLIYEFVNSLRWSVNNIHRNTEKIVSLGPLFSVPFMVYGRLRGIEVLHIESWSRFSKVSLTGRFARFIGVKVLAQNEELAEAYNLVCVGRL